MVVTTESWTAPGSKTAKLGGIPVITSTMTGDGELVSIHHFSSGVWSSVSKAIAGDVAERDGFVPFTAFPAATSPTVTAIMELLQQAAGEAEVTKKAISAVVAADCGTVGDPRVDGASQDTVDVNITTVVISNHV